MVTLIFNYRKMWLIFLLFLVVGCKHKNNLIEILPLHPYFEKDTTIESDTLCIRRIAYFYVEANLSDSVILRKKIETLASSMPDSAYRSYCVSTMFFFKKNDKFNEKYRASDYDHPEQGGKDIIAIYDWNYGIPSTLFFFNNGSIIISGADVQLRSKDE